MRTKVTTGSSASKVQGSNHSGRILPDVIIYLMSVIEKMPHVNKDLDAIEKRGGDRQKVLALVVSAALAPGTTVVRKNLQRHVATFRGMAAEIRSVAERNNQILNDWNSASYWARALSYDLKDRTVAANQVPWETIECLQECAEKCASWLERNAEALSHLQMAVSKRRTAAFEALCDYVRNSTGRKCTAILARLSNAAFDAVQLNTVSSEERVIELSEDGLKKIVQRQPERNREAKKHIRMMDEILSKTGTLKPSK
jgi:hypothetical protein